MYTLTKHVSICIACFIVESSPIFLSLIRGQANLTEYELSKARELRRVRQLHNITILSFAFWSVQLQWLQRGNDRL